MKRTAFDTTRQRGTGPFPWRAVARNSMFAALLLATACRTGRNYGEFDAPRSASPAVASPAAVGAGPRAMPDSLRLVSFNIQYGQGIDEAIAVLSTEPALREADIVLLQEMYGEGTARIAAALGMGYVYYPAAFYPRLQHDFGNAILSRWPIVADSRLTLPHRSHTTFSQRIATAATILIGSRRVRVYSVHLGTVLEISRGERRDQIEHVIRDAMPFPYVIIGGDMNSSSVGPVARQFGFDWLTARNGPTKGFGRFDHLFTRGFEIAGDAPTGISDASRRASDHRAVWVVIPTRGGRANAMPIRR